MPCRQARIETEIVKACLALFVRHHELLRRPVLLRLRPCRQFCFCRRASGAFSRLVFGAVLLAV